MLTLRIQCTNFWIPVFIWDTGIQGGRQRERDTGDTRREAERAGIQGIESYCRFLYPASRDTGERQRERDTGDARRETERAGIQGIQSYCKFLYPASRDTVGRQRERDTGIQNGRQRERGTDTEGVTSQTWNTVRRQLS